MMTYPYTYYEHKYYKNLHMGLLDYVNVVYAGKEIPSALEQYSEYLAERYTPIPASIFEFKELSDIRDSEDFRYPSDRFLIALRETLLQMTVEKYREIMDIVYDAWYDFCHEEFKKFDESTLTYTLYTCGWSGNEDIIDALLGNISIRPLLDVYNKGAVWIIKYAGAD